VVIPLSILALFAVFLGFIASDVVGLGSDFFGNSLFYHPSQIYLIEAEFSLPLYIKLFPTILSLLGGSLAFYLYNYNPSFIVNLTYSSISSVPARAISSYMGKESLFSHKSLNTVSAINRKIYRFLNGKYFFDILYNSYLITGGLQLGYVLSKVIDKGAIELIGPFGLTEGSYSASTILSKLDNGVITTYALYMTLGLTSLLFVLFTPFFFSPILSTNLVNEQSNFAMVSEMIINIYSIKLLLISIFTTYIIFNRIDLSYTPFVPSKF
jgi:NADH-ubiquinone oxidoreductase chain 5